MLIDLYLLSAAYFLTLHYSTVTEFYRIENCIYNDTQSYRVVGVSKHRYIFIFSLLQLLQRFRLEYHHEPLEPYQKLIAVPDKPVKIKFIDRF